jgi:protein Tex
MDESLNVDFAGIADELKITEKQVQNVTDLLDDGNTVPFITRYRKERTGNLNEDRIREIQKRVHAQRQVAERAQTILRLIETQGKLTPELRQAILEAPSLKRLEDLYLPYRPKRTSRASQARDRGLQPLADAIWNQAPSVTSLESAAAGYVNPEKELPDVDAVLQGTADILAELVSEDADVRARCRRIASRTGRLEVAATKGGQESGSEYRDYFNFSEAVQSVPPHRVLAINRGEKAGALRVKFVWDDARANTELIIQLRVNDHRHPAFLQRCLTDAVSRLIGPSLEREIRREMQDAAELHAIGVFARNLRNLLLQPPMKGRRVLAVDPGFRTGCKTAVLDEYGNCLATDVIYVTGSAEKRAASLQKLAELLQTHECRLVVIGNGTACRETEELISDLVTQKLPEARYLIVNEAGASIYSTSTVAGSEFPDLDATVRGTISIGRRVLDPLSELVKIEPQHIGVGLYQHDLNSKRLKESLDEVVESCVNFVGVDLNTASASLLKYVSGFNQLIARRVVEWREQNGRFTSRRQLQDVAGIGEATFTQAAGFLKIDNGEEVLDATWIHPESYPVTRKLLQRLEITPESLCEPDGKSDDHVADAASVGSEAGGFRHWRARFRELDVPALAEELQVGLPTLQDILDALARPGRDPRGDLPGPVFKQGILKLDDLQEGMELRGTILNVVDFGAFVDVGLKDSGLVHISQLANRYVKTPHDVVSVGDIVTVWVMGVDRDRKRVSLTMISPDGSKPAKKRKRSRKRKSGRKAAAAGQPAVAGDTPPVDEPTTIAAAVVPTADEAPADATPGKPSATVESPSDEQPAATSDDQPPLTEPDAAAEPVDRRSSV